MPLTVNELDELWELFPAIHDTLGGDECRAENMASRRREFIEVKVNDLPSYLDHYWSSCKLSSELRQEHGDSLYRFLFLGSELHRSREDVLADLKRYVIDEFIRIYVSSGGFRSFESRNYEKFVHASSANQLTRIANKYYTENDTVHVAVVRKTRVAVPIKWKPATAGIYPHIYSPLNMCSVEQVLPFYFGKEGEFSISV